jgi:hypothetical protein
MRILPVILTAAVFLSLAACASPSPRSEAPVINGPCIISAHSLTNDQPTNVHLAGKTFLITPDTISWDRTHSLKLPPGWGLLEFSEAPTAIAINLDGVKLADVAK